MRHPREDQPALITDAPESLDDEFDRRRKRYAITMAVRALCVLAAALTYHVSWLLAVGFAVGGAVLPWCAVLLANDRPPRKAREVRRYYGGSDEKALTSRDKAPPPPDERTVDG